MHSSFTMGSDAVAHPEDPAVRFDPATARTIAELIRSHADEVTEASMRRYARDYPYSTSGGIGDEGALRWAATEYLSLAEQLETGSVNPSEHEGVGGDMVINREQGLYAIDAYLEACLFHARVVAWLIWKYTVGDTRALNARLGTLEAFMQLKIRANLELFARGICQPRALSHTWRLGEDRQTPFTPATVDGVSSDCDPGADPLLVLTARELEMACLVAEGRSNGEIAASLGVRLSTVKNTLSRVYAKLGVEGRVQLAALLIDAGRVSPR